MKQIVCLKITPKIEQVKFDEQKKTVVREGVENEINDADKNALEVALKVKDSVGGTVVVLSMGPPSFEPFLKLAVAMGADDAILLSDRLFAGADTFATSRVLAAAIKKLAPYDMVFCGEASSDGSTEQVPPSLAEWLGVPHVSYVSEMSVTGGVARAKRDITDGYEVVEANLPILASMRLGCNTPRFPDFRRKRWADKEFKLTIWGANDLGLGPAEMGSEGSYTIVKELRSMKMPQRKSEVMTGDSKDIAAKIAKVIRES